MTLFGLWHLAGHEPPSFQRRLLSGQLGGWGPLSPSPGLSDIPSPFLLPVCLALPQTLTSARCPQERPPPATTTATTTWAASTAPAVWAMFSTGTSAPAQVSHSWKGGKGATLCLAQPPLCPKIPLASQGHRCSAQAIEGTTGLGLIDTSPR